MRPAWQGEATSQTLSSYEADIVKLLMRFF
jgi:hypothetical protein